MQSGRLVPVVVIAALGLSACRRENSEKPSDRSGAALSSSAPTVARPASGPSALREALGIPSNVDMEAQHSPLTPAAARKVKSSGGLSELLEGDVYFFTADSVKPCGEPANTAAGEHKPIVVGAKVQIKAKSKLTFSPREISLHGGGITYNASMDLDRELKGCTPLLKVSWLKKDEVIEGFVLFDVPPPEPKKLELYYLPTRWGGASAVRVALPECVTCRR
jgi:hypothetical protein